MKLNRILTALALLIIGVLGGYFFSKNQALVPNELGVRTVYKDDSTIESSNTTATSSNKREIDPVEVITDIESATIKLFEETAPSVCFINTSQVLQNRWSRNVQEVPSGTGSGFIWDEEGHIVTNYHVIKGANRRTVTLSDMSSWEAEIVGVDKNKDLAVLKINAPSKILKPIKVGSSDDLKVGQSVFAIGNPFGLDQTLTKGIISATGREIKSQSGIPIKGVIQTDAAINPGNSGGPLLDSSGRLIGVNTMIYSPSGASAGIGFSIPVDEVNWVVSDLVSYGEVRKPVMGVALVASQYTRQAGIEGALILDVTASSPAEIAGLHPTFRNQRGDIELGDIIIAINDDEVQNNNDVYLALEKYAPGDTISVTFIRKGRTKAVELILGSSVDV